MGSIYLSISYPNHQFYNNNNNNNIIIIIIIIIIPYPTNSLLRPNNPTLRIRLIHNPLLISPDIPIELLHLAPIANPQTRTHILQHGNIVTNHQHAALEVFERQAQRVHGLDIEMVRRLVEDENVRVPETQTRECYAGFLAAGKEVHFLEAGGACDAEGAEVAAVFFVLFTGVIFRHVGDCAGVEV